jgi:hypothetical protein
MVSWKWKNELNSLSAFYIWYPGKKNKNVFVFLYALAFGILAVKKGNLGLFIPLCIVFFFYPGAFAQRFTF